LRAGPFTAEPSLPGPRRRFSPCFFLCGSYIGRASLRTIFYPTCRARVDFTQAVLPPSFPARTFSPPPFPPGSPLSPMIGPYGPVPVKPGEWRCSPTLFARLISSSIFFFFPPAFSTFFPHRLSKDTPHAGFCYQKFPLLAWPPSLNSTDPLFPFFSPNRCPGFGHSFIISMYLRRAEAVYFRLLFSVPCGPLNVPSRSPTHHQFFSITEDRFFPGPTTLNARQPQFFFFFFLVPAPHEPTNWCAISHSFFPLSKNGPGVNPFP